MFSMDSDEIWNKGECSALGSQETFTMQKKIKIFITKQKVTFLEVETTLEHVSADIVSSQAWITANASHPTDNSGTFLLEYK